LLKLRNSLTRWFLEHVVDDFSAALATAREN
jgi:hypothetical protein